MRNIRLRMKNDKKIQMPLPQSFSWLLPQAKSKPQIHHSFQHFSWTGYYPINKEPIRFMLHWCAISMFPVIENDTYYSNFMLKSNHRCHWWPFVRLLCLCISVETSNSLQIMSCFCNNTILDKNIAGTDVWFKWSGHIKIHNVQWNILVMSIH